MRRHIVGIPRLESARETTVHATLQAASNEPWMADALCAQVDTEIFFPEKGGSAREAKEICARCDVQAQCLLYAAENQERHGVWGGMSERERARMFYQGIGKPVHEAPCGTEAAYQRHRRRGETPDAACRKASADATRRRVAEKRQSS